MWRRKYVRRRHDIELPFVTRGVPILRIVQLSWERQQTSARDVKVEVIFRYLIGWAEIKAESDFTCDILFSEKVVVGVFSYDEMKWGIFEDVACTLHTGD